MVVRFSGSYTPWEGWVTQYYFHVLTHDNKPLYAPQQADDDFWRKAITNLAARGSNIAEYWDRVANDFVHLPFPGPPAHAPEDRDQAIPLTQENYDRFHGEDERRRLEFYGWSDADRWNSSTWNWNRGTWNRGTWHQEEWRDHGWHSSSSSWDTYPQRQTSWDGQWGQYTE